MTSINYFSSISLPHRRPPLRLGWFLIVTVWLAGCTGYSLGPTNGTYPGARTIQIAPVSNGTDEPRLGDTVNQALRAQVNTDGTFRLASRDDADIVITTALRKFVRNPLTFQRNDIIATRDYDIVLTAHVTAIERGSGKTLLDREVTGRTTIRSSPDLSSAERQSSPLLAENLARNIISLLSEGSW